MAGVRKYTSYTTRSKTQKLKNVPEVVVEGPQLKPQKEKNGSDLLQSPEITLKKSNGKMNELSLKSDEIALKKSSGKVNEPSLKSTDVEKTEEPKIPNNKSGRSRSRKRAAVPAEPVISVPDTQVLTEISSVDQRSDVVSKKSAIPEKKKVKHGAKTESKTPTNILQDEQPEVISMVANVNIVSVVPETQVLTEISSVLQKNDKIKKTGAPEKKKKVRGKASSKDQNLVPINTERPLNGVSSDELESHEKVVILEQGIKKGVQSKGGVNTSSVLTRGKSTKLSVAVRNKCVEEEEEEEDVEDEIVVVDEELDSLKEVVRESQDIIGCALSDVTNNFGVEYPEDDENSLESSERDEIIIPRVPIIMNDDNEEVELINVPSTSEEESSTDTAFSDELFPRETNNIRSLNDLILENNEDNYTTVSAYSQDLFPSESKEISDDDLCLEERLPFETDDHANIAIATQFKKFRNENEFDNSEDDDDDDSSVQIISDSDYDGYNGENPNLINQGEPMDIDVEAEGENPEDDEANVTFTQEMADAIKDVETTETVTVVISSDERCESSSSSTASTTSSEFTSRGNNRLGPRLKINGKIRRSKEIFPAGSSSSCQDLTTAGSSVECRLNEEASDELYDSFKHVCNTSENGIMENGFHAHENSISLPSRRIKRKRKNEGEYSCSSSSGDDIWEDKPPPLPISTGRSILKCHSKTFTPNPTTFDYFNQSVPHHVAAVETEEMCGPPPKRVRFEPDSEFHTRYFQCDNLASRKPKGKKKKRPRASGSLRETTLKKAALKSQRKDLLTVEACGIEKKNSRDVKRYQSQIGELKSQDTDSYYNQGTSEDTPNSSELFQDLTAHNTHQNVIGSYYPHSAIEMDVNKINLNFSGEMPRVFQVDENSTGFDVTCGSSINRNNGDTTEVNGIEVSSDEIQDHEEQSGRCYYEPMHGQYEILNPEVCINGNGSQSETEDENFSEMHDPGDMFMLSQIQTTNASAPIFPALLHCTHSVHPILTQLTLGHRVPTLQRVFDERGILCIGDLCSKTASEIMNYPIKSPKLKTIIETLSDYERQFRSPINTLLDKPIMYKPVEHEPDALIFDGRVRPNLDLERTQGHLDLERTQGQCIGSRVLEPPLVCVPTHSQSQPLNLCNDTLSQRQVLHSRQPMDFMGFTPRMLNVGSAVNGIHTAPVMFTGVNNVNGIPVDVGASAYEKVQQSQPNSTQEVHYFSTSTADFRNNFGQPLTEGSNGIHRFPMNMWQYPNPPRPTTIDFAQPAVIEGFMSFILSTAGNAVIQQLTNNKEVMTKIFSSACKRPDVDDIYLNVRKVNGGSLQPLVEKVIRTVYESSIVHGDLEPPVGYWTNKLYLLYESSMECKTGLPTDLELWRAVMRNLLRLHPVDFASLDQRDLSSAPGLIQFMSLALKQLPIPRGIDEATEKEMEFVLCSLFELLGKNARSNFLGSHFHF